MIHLLLLLINIVSATFTDTPSQTLEWTLSAPPGISWYDRGAMYNELDNTLFLIGQNGTNAVIMKMTTSASTIWSKNIGSPGWTFNSRRIMQDPRDLTIYFVFTQVQGNGYAQGCLRKYDPTITNQLWEYCMKPATSSVWSLSEQFHLALDEAFDRVVLAFASNVPVNNYTFIPKPSSIWTDSYIVSIDASNGNVIQVTQIGNAGELTSIVGIGIVIGPLDSKILIGGTKYSPSGFWNPWSRTYSSSHELLANLSLYGSQCTGAYDATLSYDKSYLYIVGDTHTPNYLGAVGLRGSDMFLLVIDSSTGLLSSAVMIGSAGGDMALGVAVRPDYPGVFVSGMVQGCLNCSIPGEYAGGMDAAITEYTPIVATTSRKWSLILGTAAADGSSRLFLGRQSDVYLSFSTAGIFQGKTGVMLVKYVVNTLPFVDFTPNSSSSSTASSSSSSASNSDGSLNTLDISQYSSSIDATLEEVPTLVTSPGPTPSEDVIYMDEQSGTTSSRSSSKTAPIEKGTATLILETIRTYAIIISALAGAVLTLCVGGCLGYRRKADPRAKSRIMSTDQSNTSYSSFQGDSTAIVSSSQGYSTIQSRTAGSTTGTRYGSNGSTSGSSVTLATSFGKDVLSIPAFLKIRFGLDVRPAREIKSGGGGSVYCADLLAEVGDTPPGKVVVKVFSHSDNANIAQAVMQEISVTYLLSQHQNFVKFIAYCDQPLAMVLKFYQYGSLASLITNKPMYLSKRIVHSFLHDISSGLSFMARKGFAHCDVKPDNVLVDSTDYGGLFCVLTDFGIAQIVNQKSLGVQGFNVSNIRGASIAYASPESFLRTKPGAYQPAFVILQTDVYSFGILLMELLCSRSHGSVRFNISKSPNQSQTFLANRIKMNNTHLNKTWKVKINDDRTFTGTCKCMDREMNLMLTNTQESRENVIRTVGMVMIPGKHVKSIQIETQ